MVVMAIRGFVDVAPPNGGASPFVTISSPHIGVIAVAPEFLGTALVLRILTPVVRFVLVVSWEAGVGFTGARALESSSLISSEGPIEQGGTRRRSCRRDPLTPKSGKPGSRPG